MLQHYSYTIRCMQLPLVLDDLPDPCRLCGHPVAERGPLSKATAGHEALPAGHR